MAAAKKKPKIQARDVVLGSRTLEAALLDLAEQGKISAARSARAEELATIALQTIAAVTQDLRSVTQEVRSLTQEVRSLTQEVRSLTRDVHTLAQRTDDRLGALEKVAAAE